MNSRLIKFLLMLVLIGALSLQANGENKDWLRNPFYFTAKNDPISLLLDNFCAAQGVTAVISPQITGKVSGEFMFSTPSIFLDVITRNNGLTWYFDGNNAYFYTLAENDSAVIQLRWLTPARLKATLIDMGLYDSRFLWHGLPEERIIYLTGPPRYIQLIRNLVIKLESTASSDMVMRVYKLNHAWADDITLTFMEKEISIPGVASLLRTITGGGSPAPVPRVQTTKSLGVLEQKELERIEAKLPPPDTTQNWTKAARILADPRLNAVIVWDLRERMPYYEQAISQLDTPVGLVEIRAAIVDVSINRLDELGVSWNISKAVDVDAKKGTGGYGTVGGANVGVPPDTTKFFSNAGNGLNLTTIYANGIDQFMMRVNAIESDGDANTLSRPAVLTLDNVQAMLQKTNTFYVKLQGKDDVDLHDVTYGTVLKVTPHIINTPEGQQIKLVVNIEDGSENLTARGSDDIPVVSRSTINTQAIVGESQALVIGGHYFEKRKYSDSGIPGLRKIPLLGPLFNKESYNVERVERLFVISPRIVNLKNLAEIQQRIKEDTFSKSIITPDGSVAQDPEPDRGPYAGCTRKNIRPAHP